MQFPAIFNWPQTHSNDGWQFPVQVFILSKTILGEIDPHPTTTLVMVGIGKHCYVQV